MAPAQQPPPDTPTPAPPAGVSDAGVVELQAQLYRTQQQVAAWKDSGLDPADKHVRRKAGLDVAALAGRSNPGVAARAAADKLELKQTTGEGAERLAASAAALERKAALYERLARGEADDREEAYEVRVCARVCLGGSAGEGGQCSLRSLLCMCRAPVASLKAAAPADLQFLHGEPSCHPRPSSPGGLPGQGHARR